MEISFASVFTFKLKQMCINKSITTNIPQSPLCTKCDANTEETVHHYLFECDHYQQERAPLNQKLRRKAHEISYLLTNPTATLPLLKFIHATGRLKNTFGDITTNNLRED